GGAVLERVQLGAAVDDHGAAAGPAGRPRRVVFRGEAVGVVVVPLAAGVGGDADGAAVPVHAGAGVGAVVAARPAAAGGVGRDVVALVGRAQVGLDGGAADAAPAVVAGGRVSVDAGAGLLEEVVLLDEG